MTNINRKLSVAPMMDCTDRHQRYLMRLLTRHTLLYTEMVTTGALIHGDREVLLGFDPKEHPIALQLGGSDPEALARCSKIAEDWGYDEINLNVGCPSDRVQNGAFGACLMAKPELVAECVNAMINATKLPVTIKSRIGIDNQDSYEALSQFVGTVASAGCNSFIIHARKAILKGLSPKQNREIPPLIYDFVYQIKRDFPNLEIAINGGIQDLDGAIEQLKQVDGVMIGRAAYHNPYILSEADHRIFSSHSPQIDRLEIIDQFKPYISRCLKQGTPLKHMVKPLFGLFHGQPGARQYRRYLSENVYTQDAGLKVLEHAVERVSN